jgi:hypothetical protein
MTTHVRRPTKKWLYVIVDHWRVPKTVVYNTSPVYFYEVVD